MSVHNRQIFDQITDFAQSEQFCHLEHRGRQGNLVVDDVAFNMQCPVFRGQQSDHFVVFGRDSPGDDPAAVQHESHCTESLCYLRVWIDDRFQQITPIMLLFGTGDFGNNRPGLDLFLLPPNDSECTGPSCVKQTGRDRSSALPPVNVVW